MNIATELELAQLIKEFAKTHPDISTGFSYIPNTTYTSRIVFELDEQASSTIKDTILAEAFENDDVLDPDNFEYSEEDVCNYCDHFDPEHFEPGKEVVCDECEYYLECTKEK